MASPRPRSLPVMAGTVVAGVTLLVGALVAAAWWSARDDIAWSSTLPGGAYRVLDWDDSRVLLASPSRVALLDRGDGSVMRQLRIDVADQAWLRPEGGFITLSRDDGTLQAWEDEDPAGEDVLSSDMEPVWQATGAREDPLRLLATSEQLMVVQDGGAGELRGLRLEDGSTAWTTRVQRILPTYSSGQMLDEIGVVGAFLPGDRSASLLSVDDGDPVAELPVVDDVESFNVWGDRALVDAGDRLWVVSPDETVELDVPWERALLAGASQAGGVVTATDGEASWGIDLERATISALPAVDEPGGYESAYQPHQVDDRLTAVYVDGMLTGVDRATGEQLFTLDGVGVTLAQGAETVLVQREPAGADAWLERMATWRADAGVELQVVDTDATTYGSVVTDGDEVGDRATLDDHEAVVVLQGEDFAIEESRVVLLGR